MEGSFFYRSFFSILFFIFICIFSFSTLFKSLSVNSGNFIIQNDVIVSNFSITTDSSKFIWPTPRLYLYYLTFRISHFSNYWCSAPITLVLILELLQEQLLLQLLLGLLLLQVLVVLMVLLLK